MNKERLLNRLRILEIRQKELKDEQKIVNEKLLKTKERLKELEK